VKSPCELLLHRSKTIPPLLLGFERFEENKPKKLTELNKRYYEREICLCKDEFTPKLTAGARKRGPWAHKTF